MVIDTSDVPTVGVGMVGAAALDGGERVALCVTTFLGSDIKIRRGPTLQKT
jgi:hypothetical protein